MLEDYLTTRHLPAEIPAVETGPVHFSGVPAPGVYLTGEKAIYFATIVAQFIRNPCKLSRDVPHLLALSDLADILLSCAVEGTRAEELQSRARASQPSRRRVDAAPCGVGLVPDGG